MRQAHLRRGTSCGRLGRRHHRRLGRLGRRGRRRSRLRRFNDRRGSRRGRRGRRRRRGRNGRGGRGRRGSWRRSHGRSHIDFIDGHRKLAELQLVSNAQDCRGLNLLTEAERTIGTAEVLDKPLVVLKVDFCVVTGHAVRRQGRNRIANLSANADFRHGSEGHANKATVNITNQSDFHSFEDYSTRTDCFCSEKVMGCLRGRNAERDLL